MAGAPGLGRRGWVSARGGPPPDTSPFKTVTSSLQPFMSPVKGVTHGMRVILRGCTRVRSADVTARSGRMRRWSTLGVRKCGGPSRVDVGYGDVHQEGRVPAGPRRVAASGAPSAGAAAGAAAFSEAVGVHDGLGEGGGCLLGKVVADPGDCAVLVLAGEAIAVGAVVGSG